MSLENSYSYKIFHPNDGGEPFIEYFDSRGNNVTPLPLAASDDEEDQEDDKSSLNSGRGKKLILPPKKHTVMKTLLHVTTALYSMAGLGSLEQSKAFKELNQKSSSGENEMEILPDEATQGKDKDEVKPLQMDSEGPFARYSRKSQEQKPMAPKNFWQKPDQMLAKSADVIDILLEETDTIWMLDIPGTCVELDPEQASLVKNEEDNQELNEIKKIKTKKPMNSSKFELVESWTQTMDFSKKRKGVQCDDINVQDGFCQASTKDFFSSNPKRSIDARSSKFPSRTPSPKP